MKKLLEIEDVKEVVDNIMEEYGKRNSVAFDREEVDRQTQATWDNMAEEELEMSHEELKGAIEEWLTDYLDNRENI